MAERGGEMGDLKRDEKRGIIILGREMVIGARGPFYYRRLKEIIGVGVPGIADREL